MGIELIHSCMDVTRSCKTCFACAPLREVHAVPTSGGTAQVLRCSHCDGEDAHTSVRPHTAHAPHRPAK